LTQWSGSVLRTGWRATDHNAAPTLCRYCTRPALANERVQTHAAGQVLLKLKTA